MLPYELKKLAIAKQPKRPIQAPSLTLDSKTKDFLNPWLEPQSQHQLKALDFLGHLELVNTLEGIQSWSSLACDFIQQNPSL